MSRKALMPRPLHRRPRVDGKKHIKSPWHFEFWVCGNSPKAPLLEPNGSVQNADASDFLEGIWSRVQFKQPSETLRTTPIPELSIAASEYKEEIDHSGTGSCCDRMSFDPFENSTYTASVRTEHTPAPSCKSVVSFADIPPQSSPTVPGVRIVFRRARSKLGILSGRTARWFLRASSSRALSHSDPAICPYPNPYEGDLSSSAKLSKIQSNEGPIESSLRPRGRRHAFSSAMGKYWRRRKSSVLQEHNDTGTKWLESTANQVCIEDFELGPCVGSGSYSSVVLAIKRNYPRKNQLFAIKMIDKVDSGSDRRARKERIIMAHLRQCAFTLHCRYGFQSCSIRYIATDFFTGGSLEAQLQRAPYRSTSSGCSGARCLEPRRVTFHASEILLALRYMHDRSICHRDVKLSNILIDASGHAVVGDFGFAKTGVHPGKQMLRTFCGTIEYLAPEVLRGEKYGLTVDWWAFGIAIYQMLCGRTPFYDRAPRQMFAKILRAEIPGSDERCSAEAFVTIGALLHKNPVSRLGYGAAGADNIMSSPLFQDMDFGRLQAKSITPPFKIEPILTEAEAYAKFGCSFATVHDAAGSVGHVNDCSNLAMARREWDAICSLSQVPGAMVSPTSPSEQKKSSSYFDPLCRRTVF